MPTLHHGHDGTVGLPNGIHPTQVPPRGVLDRLTEEDPRTPHPTAAPTPPEADPAADAPDADDAPHLQSRPPPAHPPWAAPCPRRARPRRVGPPNHPRV